MIHRIETTLSNDAHTLSIVLITFVIALLVVDIVIVVTVGLVILLKVVEILIVVIVTLLLFASLLLPLILL